MNNETVDWLARNVHVWPSATPKVIPSGDAMFEFGAIFYEDSVYIYGNFAGCGVTATKLKWLARRAELQNKPSWDAVPNHANWMTQDAAGTWLWHSTEPEPRNGMWIGEVTRGYAEKGAVLGNWRDTLERRPESAKTRAQAEVELVSAVAEVFQPIISIEDNQEQGMKQGNGWFERGELPPVGIKCQYVVSDRLSVEVEITANAKLGLCFVQVGQSGESYVSKNAELHRFRPIRTEREKAIEDIAKIICKSGLRIDYFKDAAVAIYDAGYRKEQK